MNEDNTAYEECLLARRLNTQAHQKKKDHFKGPFKVVRLCILGILLPCFIVSLILYMRYRVYVEQLYPLAISDMRMLDNRISTTWCQRQLVRTNATFNAFLLPEPPTIAVKNKPMTMVRHLELEDDTKEYWGFYLLRGSTVTISTCVRWPGASLIVIRGHKHLHECAYIGDNSSEELDELLEAIREGSYKTTNSTPPIEEDDAPSNDPLLMKRHREDVLFHHPKHKIKENQNHTLEDEELDTTDITDSKTLKRILELLNVKAGKKQQGSTTKKPHVHMHRNSTIGKGEKDNIKISVGGNNNATTSEEVLSEVLSKLHSLGNRSESILERLNHKFRNKSEVKSEGTTEHVVNIKGRNRVVTNVKFDDNIDRARRRKRELILETARGFNAEEDEEDNVAQEEGFIPDGIADHHATINETTLNDKSNSEFWSSFSSSEEALLNCAGLILNLPLTPHTQCKRDLSDVEVESAYLANRITYKVPTNGYYFFVFNSENEIQKNYVRVNFHIEKTVYNVTNPIAQCENSTEQCSMDLKFFSDEKLVMELPIKEDEDLWNQEYVVVSICEPRTTLYAACVLAVPILVVLFAFQ